jgi:uncharacterized protein DUF4232
VRRIAALAFLLLAACSHSPTPRAPQARATTTTAQGATTTTTAATAASTTSTTSGALAKPCGASDVGIGEITSDGASHHNLMYVRLKNVSQFTCSLSGFPTSVTAVDQDGHSLEHVDQGAYQPDPPAGDIQPGATGLLIIDTRTECTDANGNETHPPTRMFRNFQIGLPGGGTVSLGDVVVDGTCGVAVSKFGVSS